jgi:hypothetical protein
MEYSWTLRVAGEKIRFLPDVSVYGQMLISGGEGTANQRRRWEFGRSELRAKFVGSLLRSPNLAWPDKLLSLCELTIPSMAGLAAIYLVVVGLDIILLWTSAGSPHAILRAALAASAIIMTLALGVYAVSPCLAMRLPLRYLGTLFQFPFYACWKLLVSLAGRPDQWIRTDRDSGP